MAEQNISACLVASLCGFRQSLPKLLDKLSAAKILRQQQRIPLKPDLVNTLPPPITLPIAAMETLLGYDCRESEHIRLADGVLGNTEVDMTRTARD